MIATKLRKIPGDSLLANELLPKGRIYELVMDLAMAVIRTRMAKVAPRGENDVMDVGRHGGGPYSAERLGKLGRYLNRRGVELVLDDPVMLKVKKAGFARDGSKLYLPSDATRYEVMHELGHYVHFRRIGKDAYQALPRPTVPEQAVYDLLRRNARRWYEQMNFMERLDAQLKIERDGGIAW